MAERPLQPGAVYGTTAAQQEAIALADMMQLELGQKDADVIDQLTNNDFEGDFFTIGDTVKVVSINPNSIKVVEGDKNDIRPTLDRLAFGQATMVIDKKREFAFQIKDLDRIEDKWNHESAAHALAARKMRQANCLDVLNLITTAGNVAAIGSLAAPIDITVGTGAGQCANEMESGNKLYRLILAMKEYLNTTGAVNGEEYKYGANKTVALRGTASLFAAPGIHAKLLAAQYVRVDDVSEDVIRNGKYEKIAGLLFNSTPMLDANYDVHVAALDDSGTPQTGVGILVLGTKNTVTRAGKVLPPEKMRDYVHFADNYYGREIYGRMIACPEACVIAFVKFGSEFTITDFTNTGLFTQYAKENPVRANDYPTLTNPNVFPQLANAEYLQGNIDMSNYATTEALAGHTHTIEKESIDGTNPIADITLPVDEGE